MPDLHLIPHMFSNLNTLDPILQDLTGLGFSVRLIQKKPDFESFMDPNRGQYDALKIIQQLDQPSNPISLICTTVDLYIPIFTFVFGLAKLNGRASIISTHRLNNKYYGLPEDEFLLRGRIIKETRHELGHLSGLRHCPNYNCVMSSSATAEEVDVKSDQFCHNCNLQFQSLLQRST